MYNLLLASFILANSVFPPTTWYKLKSQNDTERLQVLKDQIQQKDRTLCPRLRSKSYSPCLQEFIKTYKVQSSVSMAILVTINMYAAKLDTELGYDDITQNIFFLENTILVLEKFDPVNLHIFTFNPVSNEQAQELMQLSVMESKILDKLLINLNQQISKMGRKTQRRLAAADSDQSDYHWKQRKLQKLRKRWKKVSPSLAIKFKTLPARLEKQLKKKSL